ncbi:NAD-P-binding protein [Amanita rubescens]|nr:NAD-P-binding protein [Amanita rubescens]
MPDKPSALICGGLNTYSRALAAFLVPLEGEPLVSHLRIVDKFSVQPPTTYIGSEFPKILKKSQVEYRQANLTVPAVVSAAFEPLKDHPPFDYVFDFTGEVIHDRAEPIIINTTCNVTRLLGLEAAKRNVKAYVRIQQPFYESSKKGGHDESEDLKPAGVLGTWWHEALRILGAIDGLNLVILRTGHCYGPYTNYGLMGMGIAIMAVYGYMKKPFKLFWPPGDPVNTIHVDDVAGAAWACAEWIAPKGRAAANEAAGEKYSFHKKNKAKEVEGSPPHNKTVIAPLFNLVDDSNTTVLNVAETIGSHFKTTVELLNLIRDCLIKEINEHHVGAWTEMITNSKPPVPNTPVSPYLDGYSLGKHYLALKNKKLKETINYQLKRPNFNVENIVEVVENWRSEGNWPNLE